MPRRPLLLAVVLSFVSSIVLAPPAPAKTVRVFAVGEKVRVDDAVTVQAFHDKMFALMDATFPNRSTFVQAGVDDVASHVKPADPAAPDLVLVTFPEDVGLVAAMTGSKGAGARAASVSTGAFLLLLQQYANQMQYYRQQFAGIAQLRQLLLALTDINYRVVYETYRDIAMTYGVYVSAGVNVAAARRVESADDPFTVARLRDPDEPGRSYAYVAVEPTVYNTTMIFRPDGEVLVPDGMGGVVPAPSGTGGVYSGSVNKSYLTPIEIGTLTLAHSPVHDLDVLDTPLGRLGVVISKDAWMVDANERYDAKRANLLIQSEAFSAWAFSSSDDGPDVLKEGGFGAVQRNPNILYNVLPAMTGNLTDITFDGQSAVIGKRTTADPGPLSPDNAWVGQNPDSGFLAVAPWVIDDPGIANPGLSLADRRTQLKATGDQLLPTAPTMCPSTLSVGACRDGYRESIVFHDIQMPDGERVLSTPDPGPRVATAFGTNVQVNASEGSPVTQRHPRAIAGGGKLYVVWDDDRDGYEGVYMAVSNDGGATFGGDVKVSDNAPGSVVELFPHTALSVEHGVLYVTWQEFVNGRDDDVGRIKVARFDLTGAKLGADVRVDSGADTVGKWQPQVAADVAGDPSVVWVDERDGGPEGVRFEHIYFAHSRDGGLTFGPNVRLDDVGSKPKITTDPNAASLDNRWRPSVAIQRKQLFVAWADFRNYNWDIYSTRVRVTAKRTKRNYRVDDFAALERINTEPTVAIDPESGIESVAWTDIRARQPDSNVFFTRALGRSARVFGASGRFDSSAATFDPDVDTPTTQSHPDMKLAGSNLCIAWQDDRNGTNDVYFTHSADGGAHFAADERVDDTGAGPSAQTAPSVAIDGTRCYVVWEDTRLGNSDIFVASRTVP
jgi:predicted amidohydrolase